MKKSVYKNGKNLRFGYTTGSCATAASKAAAYMLVHKKDITTVDIMTPKGWPLKLSVVDINRSDNYVSCGIIKDSGDDPDITNGMTIYAKVSFSDEYLLTNGVGVGTVTKKGLSVPVGQAAINPVPRQMIKEHINEITNRPIHIEIYAPEGVELAKKTSNPRLGIVGGLSIIGTTGIVEPMSEEAFKDSLEIELGMIEEDSLVLTPGNYGRDYCLDHGVSENRILKISNFVGYMFDRAVEQKKKKVLFAGHIGKLIKVAGGIFHTHSRVSDARMDLLVSHMVACDVDYKHLKHVLDCNTTEEAVNYLVEEKIEEVFDLIVCHIKERLEKYTFDAIEVEVLLFSMDQGLLAQTSGVNKMMETFHE